MGDFGEIGDMDEMGDMGSIGDMGDMGNRYLTDNIFEHFKFFSLKFNQFEASAAI